MRGRIDWPRRFDHMQQHTGQHVLSAAFDRLLKAPHRQLPPRRRSSTIDLAREVSPAEIARAEAEANRVVWEDRPVDDPLRGRRGGARRCRSGRSPTRGGTLRLIDVEDFDLSACGGTHVARTGAIGMIAVPGRSGSAAGAGWSSSAAAARSRATASLRDSVAASVRLLSCCRRNCRRAIERLQEEGKDLKRQLKDQQTRLASFEAEALAGRAELDGRRPRGGCGHRGDGTRAASRLSRRLSRRGPGTSRS